MPTGRGGNLTQPLKKILINEPGPDNLGTFTDSISTLQVLQFKEHGYSLPYTGAANVNVRVTQPQAPVRKVTTVQLSNVTPADNLNYNYGINVIRRHRKPGIDNSQYFPHQKFYGGIMPSVTAVTIANAELNTMRADIISQINSDNGYTQKFDYQMPGSCVIASRPLYLENWDMWSACTLDGNYIQASSVSGHTTIARFVENINAVAGFEAVALSATELRVYRTTRDSAADRITFVAAGMPTPTPTPTPTLTASPWVTLSEVAEVAGEFILYQRFDDATYELSAVRNVATWTVRRANSFALLTNDEVQQVFSHIPNTGTLAQERRHPNLVLPNTDYVKINIDVNQVHYDLGGASHQLSFITAVELYMPAAEWNIDRATGLGGTDNLRWEAFVARRSMDAGAVLNVRDIFWQWVQ